MLNIVSPTSSISQESAPFTFLGNRGVLHEGKEITLHSDGDRWLYCATSSLEDPRDFMRPRCVTELFFLDEATALSAGHRPCPKCSYARFDEFKMVWENVFGVKDVSASDIDTKLAQAREQDGAQRTFRANIADLPGGVMIRVSGRTQPLLVFHYEHPQGTENKCVHPWTSQGYGVKESLPVGEVESVWVFR